MSGALFWPFWRSACNGVKAPSFQGWKIFTCSLTERLTVEGEKKGVGEEGKVEKEVGKEERGE